MHLKSESQKLRIKGTLCDIQVKVEIDTTQGLFKLSVNDSFEASPSTLINWGGNQFSGGTHLVY